MTAFIKASAASLASLVFNGINSTYLVRLSLKTIIYLSPFLHFGKGPNKSMWTLENGKHPTGYSCILECVGSDPLILRQELHLLVNSCTSFGIFGKMYLDWIILVILSGPG